MGRRFAAGQAPDGRKLRLRVGLGDITILKMHIPAAPRP